jgi:hypothetical protein
MMHQKYIPTKPVSSLLEATAGKKVLAVAFIYCLGVPAVYAGSILEICTLNIAGARPGQETGK